MQVFAFHLMPYPALPEDFPQRYGPPWVKLPNTLYDPKVGEQVYEQALAEFAQADALGFDGVCVNEHHQTAYGTMPSPNLMAAALTRVTQRAKIAVLGNALPLRGNPLRVAEEIAMLDVLSHGRIISGFVRGIGAEYHSFGVNPAFSHDRFHEAHDLIVAAWTRPGPFRWDGRHYQFPYVNPWPRPVQTPHPPIWIPSQGSRETIRWAAERRYTYLQTFSPIEHVERYMRLYWQVCEEEFGYTPAFGQLGWAIPIFVGRTDEEARALAKPHIEYFYERLLVMPTEYFFPPGYLSPQSMAGVLQAKRGLTEGGAANSIDALIAAGRFVCGSAKTVFEKLAETSQRLRIGVLTGMFQFATLPHALAMENLLRFADEVKPRLEAINRD
ncbi:MAG: LLM class flavin-dependent oxidoreductase [Firmicutes bacterium]|nr:LLM class flavin-dependent oxidoreductase [Alicyclobacillaceae bacterium]MCL6497116.1 LLM class flavin-dependent oxidoreductase [Bacillota bacterium]